MSTITREQLRERAREKVKSLEFAVTQAAFSDSRAELEEELELARIALASLEAEPVGFIVRNKETGQFGSWMHSKADWFKDDGYEVLNAYIAPPAPVSVPDERYQHLSELYHAMEKRLFKLAQRIKGSSFDKYAHSTSQAIDVLESALFGESTDACLAAMLQGADGNSLVVPDGWVMVPVEPTTEMQSAAASAIRFETTPINKLWTGNAVYKAMLAAAPKQEVKGWP